MLWIAAAVWWDTQAPEVTARCADSVDELGLGANRQIDHPAQPRQVRGTKASATDRRGDSLRLGEGIASEGVRDSSALRHLYSLGGIALRLCELSTGTLQR